jgi:hypothetical protein
MSAEDRAVHVKITSGFQKSSVDYQFWKNQHHPLQFNSGLVEDHQKQSIIENSIS